MIIVDYGDLLEGRDGKYKSTYESQKSVFRDLKSLANREYAVWTASQAVRPNEKDENDMTPLKAREIADCYEKVRIADFVGSINQTPGERAEQKMRLWADIYRDAPIGTKPIPVWDNRETMTLREGLPPPKPLYASAVSPVQTFGVAAHV
jgi:hypothetical protein